MVKMLVTYDKTQDTLGVMMAAQKSNAGENGPEVRSFAIAKEDAGKILKAMPWIYKKEKVKVVNGLNCFSVTVENATECASLSEQNVTEKNILVFKQDDSIEINKNDAVQLLRNILRDTVCMFRACVECPMRNKYRDCSLVMMDASVELEVTE